MPRKWPAALSIAAAMAWPEGSARAIDLMTGDGYLLALTQAPDGRVAAENQVAGSLETLIVLNVVLGQGESILFCLSDERAAVLDVPLLRNQFTDWLRATPTISNGEPSGDLPVSALVLVFLEGKFPCEATGQTNPDIQSEIRSRLLQSVPPRPAQP